MGNESVERLANSFSTRASKHLLGGGIKKNDVLILIDGDDAVHRRLDYVVQLSIILQQGFAFRSSLGSTQQQPANYDRLNHASSDNKNGVPLLPYCYRLEVSGGLRHWTRMRNYAQK